MELPLNLFRRLLATRQYAALAIHSIFSLLVLCAVILPVGPVTGQSVWLEIADLFRQARYDEAREVLLAPDAGEGGRPGEELLWQLRLTTDADEAVAMTVALRRERDLSEEMRIQVAYHEATLHFARGRYQAALTPLEDLFANAHHSLPGELHLLAGLSYWALQKIQQSREAFATIKQSDLAFGWARYYLGCISLETGDVALALRYFESAQRSVSTDRWPSLLAGTWEGLRMSGRQQEAAELREHILARFPQSLAVMHIHDVLKQEVVLVAPAPALAESILPAMLPAVPLSGRVCLQLAAFSDRGRALAYAAVWQEALPDLRIDEEMGSSNQILYKVRYGRFVSRAQAHTEAQRLDRKHGLETIIVESGQ